MVSQSVDFGYMSKQNRSMMQKKKLRKISKGSPNVVNLQIKEMPISPLAGFVKFSNNHIKKSLVVAESWASLEASTGFKYKPKVDKALTNRFQDAYKDPFLDEVEECLKIQQARDAILEKTKDNWYETQRNNQRHKSWRPKALRPLNHTQIGKAKTQRNVYDSIKAQKCIPAVPLKLLDQTSRDLTVSLMEENAFERNNRHN